MSAGATRESPAIAIVPCDFRLRCMMGRPDRPGRSGCLSAARAAIHRISRRQAPYPAVLLKKNAAAADFDNLLSEKEIRMKQDRLARADFPIPNTKTALSVSALNARGARGMLHTYCPWADHGLPNRQDESADWAESVQPLVRMGPTKDQPDLPGVLASNRTSRALPSLAE